MLERDIEDVVVRWARAKDWFVRKYRSAGRRSAPDRLFIKAGTVIFIEFKRPGEQPTALQWIEIKEMQAHGAFVYWCDSAEEAKAILAAHEGSA